MVQFILRNAQLNWWNRDIKEASHIAQKVLEEHKISKVRTQSWKFIIKQRI